MKQRKKLPSYGYRELGTFKREYTYYEKHDYETLTNYRGYGLGIFLGAWNSRAVYEHPACSDLVVKIPISITGYMYSYRENRAYLDGNVDMAYSIFFEKTGVLYMEKMAVILPLTVSEHRGINKYGKEKIYDLNNWL